MPFWRKDGEKEKKKKKEEREEESWEARRNTRESSQPRLTASKCGCRPWFHIKTSRFPSILPSTRVSSWLWRPYMYVHVCFPFWISCDQPNHTHAHPNVGIGWPCHASHSLMAIYLLQPPFGLVLPLETAWAKGWLGGPDTDVSDRVWTPAVSVRFTRSWLTL